MSISQDEIIELHDFDTASKSSGSINVNKHTATTSHLRSTPINGGGNKIFLTRSNVLPPVPKKRGVREKLDGSSATTSLDWSEASHGNSNDKITETTKSEPQSYREKVRERFKTVKDRAGSSLSRAHDLHKFRDLVDRGLSLHKNLELLKEENVLVDTEIKSYVAKLTDRKTDVSHADRYHFFCHAEEHESEHQQENNESNNNSTEDSRNIIQLVHYVLPNLLEDYIEVAENDLFWLPRTPVSLESKVEEPRFLEEEGLYVSPVPKIPYLNVLEQRLLSIDGKKWFNSDGKLKILESPLSSTCYRPTSYGNDFETEFALPTIQEHDSICQSVVVLQPNILEINIINIRYDHHPLFSVEHIFERRIISLYDLYREMNTHNSIERVAKKLETFRNVKEINSFPHAGGDGDSETKHIYEIMELRELLFKKSKHYRDTIKLILQTWKIIKKLRSQNTYSNTSVKLTIRKEKCNFEQENEIWERSLHQVSDEVKKELKFDYRRKLHEYKNNMEKWKIAKKDKPQSEELPPKPIKPTQDIDEDEIRDQITSKFKQSFKPPGEPVLHFNISHENEITTDVDNENEKLRRRAVTNTKIFFKIVCDDVDVCKSKLVPINDAFVSFVDETFSLQLSKLPRVMMIEIYEQTGTHTKRKIAELSLSLPQKNVIFKNKKVVEGKFVKEELIRYKHEGIGSGQDLNTISEKYDLPVSENGSLNTSGVLQYCLGWEQTHKNKAEVINVAENATLPAKFNEDITNSTQINRGIKIDPQDPKSLHLLEGIDTGANYLRLAVAELPKIYFRCNPYLMSLNLYESSSVDDNMRFKVLELRNNNEPEFVGMIVPNRIKEIPSYILFAYKKRINEEQTTLELDNEEDKTIDEKRASGRRRLKEIYTKVFQQCRSTENNLVYEDVVNEKLIPYFEKWITTMTANVLNWFKIQPYASKPLPKFARLDVQQEKSSMNVTPINVVINVISALNIPKRKGIRKHSRSRSNTDLSETGSVSSFVEVSYQDVVLQTAVKDGVNPRWDESLIFPLQTSNVDYLSPNSLNGSIDVDLFEEYIDFTSEVKLITWLGSIQIPLSTVCFSDKVEGFFPVISPILHINEQSTDRTQSYSSRNTTNNTNNVIYISLKLRIETKIPKLTINMEEFPCGEPPYLHRHILRWSERHNNSFPQRKFTALAIDSSRKTLCITRFIRPLEPPQMHANNFDVTPEQCARYVSLIPFTDYNKFYDQVWLSTEQMLNMMLGSTIDHAIALTCYLLALNLETWLLLGYGLPHGVTAYVLIQEYKTENDAVLHFIYDVVTGNKYNINDSFCPLQKVFMVVNDGNVWANVQKTDLITLTRFDFMSRSDWHPLFNSQITAPTNSVQLKLIYNIVNDVKELNLRLEKKIRKRIAKLRKTACTVWNHIISGILRDIVKKSEYNYVPGKLDISTYMHSIEETHTIHGFIIDLPYSSLSTIFDALKLSQIANVGIPNVEFVSAVHIHSYPNQVLVVWIALGFATVR